MSTLMPMLSRATALMFLLLAWPTVASAQEPASEEDDAASEDDAANSDARFVDLDEAISLGLVRSPQLRAAELSSQAAATRIDEAAWGWTPKFDLQASIVPMPKVGLEDTDEDAFNNLSEWGIYTKNSLEMVIPLFTSFKLSTAEELAEIGLEVELLREEEARLEIVYDVTRAYYGVQLARALLTVSNEANGLMKRVDKEFEKLLAKGDDSVDKTDRYRIDLAMGELAIGEREARDMLALAEQGLRVHTKLEGTFRVPKMNFRPDEVTLESLDEVLAIAAEQRVDVRMLDGAVQAASANLDLQQLYWWPDFFFAGRVGLAYSNAVADIPGETIYTYDPYNSFGAGFLFGMRWKLDPVNRALKVDQADLALQKLVAQQELARRGVTLDVEKHYRAASSALERVNIIKAGKRSAKRLMTQKVLDYEAGGGDADKVISAVKTYTEQRANFLMALYDFRVKLTRVQLATGAAQLDDLLAAGTMQAAQGKRAE